MTSGLGDQSEFCSGAKTSCRYRRLSDHPPRPRPAAAALTRITWIPSSHWSWNHCCAAFLSQETESRVSCWDVKSSNSGATTCWLPTGVIRRGIIITIVDWDYSSIRWLLYIKWRMLRRHRNPSSVFMGQRELAIAWPLILCNTSWSLEASHLEKPFCGIFSFYLFSAQVDIKHAEN